MGEEGTWPPNKPGWLKLLFMFVQKWNRNHRLLAFNVLVEDETRLFFRGARNTLEPGDTIVVPVETSQFNTFKAANDITQIIYQMALTAAAVNSFDWSK